jgi:acyl transferase domain-containing protein/acyl carrier protein
MSSSNQHRPIAVIGLAGRFPNAPDISAFWRNLEQGLESIVSFTDEELLAAGVAPAQLGNPAWVKKGTVLEDAELFDAAFFGFSRREAEVMDPQHRLFLECAWEALEDAGYTGQSQPECVGVYAGASMNTHFIANVARNRALMEAAGAYQLMLGNDKDFLTTRVSYKLNLKGPSVAVQTACSTSLVAVQIACQALWNGECEMALAGGVSLRFPQKAGHPYIEGMILSPDGHCRPFDAEAGGIRSGEGAGLVVLKLLDNARIAGDSVRAVIRGIAVNNDGAAKIGYTAPSVEGQAAAIAAALEMGVVDPATVSYIEAHGTATALGDPIEIAALDRLFRAHTPQTQFCAIGSVKSNIGHLDAAAGIAGLIKTVLALEHKRIPASLNFRRPNPQIDFNRSAFYVNQQLVDWSPGETPRRAGVSSFGIGGTNAHAVLEEAPAQVPSITKWPVQVLTLSARSSYALEAVTMRLGRHLADNPALPLPDICYTLQVGRKRFPYRRTLVCRDRDEVAELLSGGDFRSLPMVFEEAVSRPVAFLFSGQGSQHAGMGRDLYQVQPTFRRTLDDCAELLIPELDCDLRELLYSNTTDSSALVETRFAQPALFAVDFALAQMWMAWGVKPDAMLGHSIGEYVAATLSGVFSLEDAVRLVAARGRIMQRMPRGSMLAVQAPECELTSRVNGKLSIAGVNAPSLCTVAGSPRDITCFSEELEARGIPSQILHTSHAFHSSLMNDALDPFLECVKRTSLSPPRLAFLSNVTGTWIRPEEATDPEYWVRHMRQTVRFSDGLAALATSGRVFLEVGPSQALSTFAREATRNIEGCQVLSSLPHAKDSEPASAYILQTAARLWMAGAPLDWAAVHAGEQLHRVSLPTYPFERQCFSIEPDSASDQARPLVPAKKTDLADWFYSPSWTRSVLPSVAGCPDNDGRWLIFADRGGIGETAAAILAARGHAYLMVRPGAVFARISEQAYQIDPSRGEDYLRLLREMAGRAATRRSLLYLWGLDGGQAGLKRLLLTAQAVGDAAQDAALECLVVSRCMHLVTGRERVDPEQALLAGPAKVISKEYPQIRCRSVDIGEDLSPEVVAELLLEPGMPHPFRPVAYRDGYRWEQSFVHVRLPQERRSPLRERGVYLITGGTGGIGLTLAAYLAESTGARLALTGRTALPERADWPAWVATHGEKDETSCKIRAVEHLEELGAEVLILRADVCNREAMAKAISDIHQKLGGIHGIIHAAGIAGAGLMQLKTAEAMGRVLAPKVEGTLILESLLHSEPLDFFVLCSSINALCGTAGAVDYTSANAFLDSFAASRYRGGRATVISLNWDAWQDVGMAANTAVPRGLQDWRRQSLESAIKPAEGVEAFRRALAARLPQLAVITRDLPRLIEESDSADPAVLAGSSAGNGVKREPATPDTDLDTETATQRTIGAIWQELLGARALGIDDNFFELGGHSLLATGLLSRIAASFGVTMPLRAIFEAPTVRSLAERVDTLLWAASGAAGSEAGSEGREEVEL